MTTSVYFDLDGTLIEYTAPFDEILTRTLPVEVTDEMMDAFTELILSAIADLSEGPYRRAFADLREEYGSTRTPNRSRVRTSGTRSPRRALRRRCDDSSTS